MNRATFARNEDGGATVEFVAIMGPMMLIVFFIFEVMVEMVWIGTAEKAAQAGARLAVVSNLSVTTTSTSCPAADTTGLISVNCVTSGHNYGDQCSTGACVAYCTTASKCTCTGGSGGSCTAANFNAIFNRMAAIFGLLSGHPGYVTVTYGSSGLGFAGGPTVPAVTVTVSGVPYGGVVTGLIGNIFNAGRGTNRFASTLPTISVTLTGEDLST